MRCFVGIRGPLKTTTLCRDEHSMSAPVQPKPSLKKLGTCVKVEDFRVQRFGVWGPRQTFVTSGGRGGWAATNRGLGACPPIFNHPYQQPRSLKSG